MEEKRHPVWVAVDRAIGSVLARVDRFYSASHAVEREASAMKRDARISQSGSHWPAFEPDTRKIRVRTAS